MTETPGSTRHEQDHDGPPTDHERTARPPGVDREHLRSYEALRRSVTDRKVAGVAGGLGRHLGVDPTVLRVLFVVLCFFGGAGFLLYGVGWLLVPEDGRSQGALSTRPSTRNALLLATGVVAALAVVANGWGGVGLPWPVLVVGLGVALFLVLRDSGPEATPRSSEADPVQSTSGPLPAVSPDEDPPWLTPPPAPAYPSSAPPSRRRGPLLFGFTLALVALSLGMLGLYQAAGGAVVASAYPAVALTVVGAMLVVGSVVGRAGGLILLGLLSSGALAVTAVAQGTDGFGDGEQVTVTPTSAAQVRDSYSVGSGQLLLDLSQVRDPGRLADRVVDVRAGLGEVVVVLPPRVQSEVDADVSGPGRIDFPDGGGSGGIDIERSGRFGTGRDTITVTTHLSAGHIDVRNP